MEDPHFVALQTALAGRYSLERVLGRGGMGVVYLAHEVALDRPVTMELKAAKEISSDLEGLLEGHREVERLLAQRRATGTFTIVDE